MAIIQKRADELNPGDHVLSLNGGQEWVILRHYLAQAQDVKITVGVIGAGSAEHYWVPSGQYFEMVQPNLTPAQQHAEELVELLAECSPILGHDAISARINAMLDKITPPEPPTLAEALELIAFGAAKASGDYKPGDFTRRAEVILDRARRSGVLK